MTKSSIATIGKRGLLFFIFLLALFAAGTVNPTFLSAEIAVDNQTISIAFSGMELATFVQTMNSYLHKNFVLPPGGMTGKVTFYSGKPIPIKEAEAVFYSILNLYGFTAVPAGEVVSIIPLAEAKTKNIEVSFGSDPEQLVAFGDKTITQIVPLSYSKAEALAPLLQKSAKSGNVDSDAKTNTLIITDTARNIRKLLQMVKRFDQPALPSQETRHTYMLQNKDATIIAAELTAAMAAQKSKALRPGEAADQTTIVASPSSNALIIFANPDTYDELVKIIKELDQRPKQVLIEALVAEVSGDLVREFGIQWQFFEGAEGAYRGFGSLGGTVGATDLATLEAGLQPAGLIAGVIKGNEFPFNIGALLKLYGKDTNFKILSTPLIVTLDNKEALIKVVDTIPYTKQITYQTTSETLPTQSFEYQDVGITLKITPHISADRNVRLEISEEVTKQVETSVSVAGNPTIAKRSAQSSVIVNDGETMVLGGLTRNDSDDTMEKVPGFGDIPLLGYFFRHKTKKSQQTSLYIFVTPTVIATQEESVAITRKKEAALKASGTAK